MTRTIPTSDPAPDLLLRVLLLVALIAHTDLFLAVFVNGDRPLGPQIDAMRTVFAAARLGTTALIIVLYGFRLPRTLFPPASHTVFIAFVAISTLWSVTPGVSLQRALETVFLVIALSVATRQIGFSGTVSIVRAYLWLAIVGGVAVALIAPAIGVHGAMDKTDFALVGSWRGAFLHKNLFASPVLVLLAAIVAGSAAVRFGAPGRILAVAAVVTVLFFIGSATAIALIPAVLVVDLMLRLGRTSLFVLILIAAAVLFQTVIIHYSDDLLGLVGRDSTLTNRTVIWALWWKLAMHDPWLGHGYFSAQQAEVHAVATKILFLSAGHAHSGYLDLIFNLGFVGLGLYLAVYLGGLWSALRLNSAVRGTDPDIRFVAGTLIALLAVAMVDVTVFGLVGQMGAVTFTLLMAVRTAPLPAAPLAGPPQ